MPTQPPMPGQSVRNVPGGLSIDPSGQGRDDDDEEGDEEGSGGRDEGSEPSPPSSAVNMQPPSQLPGSQQRHTSHHGAPGHVRATASTPLSAHGAHHAAHPYGGGAQGPAREVHQAHRRKTSGSNGKVTSPRLAMQTRSASGMSVVSEGAPDGPPMQSPHGHPGHDPTAAMYGYPQQGGNPQMPQHYQPPPYPGMTGWQGMPQGAPQAHRR